MSFCLILSLVFVLTSMTFNKEKQKLFTFLKLQTEFNFLNSFSIQLLLKLVCAALLSDHTDTDLGQAVQLHGALHRHVPAQVGELHLDQLAWVQRAMPVPVDADRR